jgi:prepilin-type N-terminal cleavage/methylation domain-containing protein
MSHQIKKLGFTLVELMVVVSIIGILASIVYANFTGARAAARDDIRKSALKELQLAVELYKAQYGTYPAQGCGSYPTYAGRGTHPSWGCTADEYITGLVPDFIAALPSDPISEDIDGYGYMYLSNGTDYKIVAHLTVEKKLIGSYNDEFARCASSIGADPCGNSGPNPYTYAVYSAGASGW